MPLHEYIKRREVKATLIEKGSSEQTMQAHEFLKARGIEVKPHQMIKALVCIPLEGKKFLKEKALLAMVSGPDRLDLKKLAHATGHERVMIADQMTAESLSGYPRGGTPPIGHSAPLRVVIDTRLAEQEVLFGGGGETTKVIKITPQEIRRILEKEDQEYIEAEIRE
jgi:prolyl-tRNA editing enzyme YbaK/EbsC (Cys-tRNA(Pro) deacylase)